MDDQLTAELIGIFRATAILSPTTCSFAGRLAPQPDPAWQQILGPSAPQHPLVAQLQQQLYQHCYCQRFQGRLQDASPAPGQADSMSRALSEANTSRERWDAGWQIQQILPNGQMAAHKHGRTRMLWPGEFMSYEGPGMAPRVGANIGVFMPKESHTMQPGFYFAFGETIADQQDDYSIVRFYWAIGSAGATSLVRLITRGLNRFYVPFRFKCANYRSFFNRLDAAVLYVNKRFYHITAELLLDAHAGIREHLRPETPLFTKQLASGLGLAEDPGTGESFGMSRCRILAEAIVSAYAEGLQTEQARLHAARKQFEQYGLALERPYLNAGSVDQYDAPNHQV